MNVYNVEPYIAEALSSIQSQTFSDIQIVVVDDGSTDRTRAIAEKMAIKDPRIKVVGSALNRGISQALNLGLAFCSAPFIAKMDGDDIALPMRLEKQLGFLEEHPEIALVGCATTAIDKFSKPLLGLGISRKPAGEELISRTKLLAAPCLHIWLARSEVYKQLAGYREMMFAEDYDFLLRALSTGFHISNLAEPLMQIRTRPGNVSSRLELRKAHKYVVHLYRERLKHGKDSFSKENYCRAIKAMRIEDVAFRLATKCVQKGLKHHIKIVRYGLLLISVLISPWQARYFFDRLCFRAMARIYGL
jgi:glycosyltransferase involved in cell wall biosynthesis